MNLGTGADAATQAEAEALLAETTLNGTAGVNGRAAGAELLAARGLVVIEDDKIRLTSAGRYASRPGSARRSTDAPGLDLPADPQPAPPDVQSAVEELQAKDRARRKAPPVKETPEDKAVSNNAYGIAADELRQFIERYEQLDSEKKDVATQQKELMAEAKGRGYDTKAMRKIVALRKRKPDDIAEEEAVLDMYKAALGMS